MLRAIRLITDRPPVFPPKPPKRSYRLSAQGMAALRQSARRHRPWEHATGPRTPAGKRRSSLNALKHGLRAQDWIPLEREFRQALREAERSMHEVWAILREFDKIERDFPSLF